MAGHNNDIFEKMTARQETEEKKAVNADICDYEEQKVQLVEDQKELDQKSRNCEFVDHECLGRDCSVCIHRTEAQPEEYPFDDYPEEPEEKQCPHEPCDGDCEACDYNLGTLMDSMPEEECPHGIPNEDCAACGDCDPRPKEERFHAECRSENCPGCDWRHQCPDSSILTEEEKKACSMLCDKCPNQCDFAKGLAAQAIQEKQGMDEDLDELKRQEDAALEKEYVRLEKELDESKEKVENLLNNLNDKVSASLNRLNEKASANIEQISKMVNELRHPEDFHDEKETCELECELCQDSCQTCVVSQFKPGATTPFADDFPPIDRLQS